MKIRIATRKSPLALWQAEHVGQELVRQDATLEIELVKLTTKGDKILDQALSKVGGKDLFVKEIEAALLDGRAQIAVHSLKDVPTEVPDGLNITAFPVREDPRDALVSNRGYRLDTLPQGAVVGTCSLRRAAQLLSLRPDLKIAPIRGNVQTRLQKLESEGMDATVLAYAGLLRLGLSHLATEVISPDRSLPAIGQGILAVQTNTSDEPTNRLVRGLDDPASRAAATMERAFLRRLQGGCQVPIAGHALVHGDHIQMRGLVASLDGKQVVRGETSGATSDAYALGDALAQKLLGEGAGAILEALQGTAQ